MLLGLGVVDERLGQQLGEVLDRQGLTGCVQGVCPDVVADDKLPTISTVDAGQRSS